MADLNTTGNTTYSALNDEFIINNILGLIGCLINGFICVLIGTRQALSQPFNHLILNLSVANFVLSFSIILDKSPNYLAPFLSYNDISTAIGSMICKLNFFFFLSSLAATCFTLLIISIERYQAVAAIRIHVIKLSATRKVIVIIWIIASISAIIPTCFAEINPILYNNCYMRRIQSIVLIISFILLFSFSSFLPTLLMLIIYSLIIYKLYINIQVSPSTLSSEARNRKKGLRRSIVAIILISILSTGSGIPALLLNFILIVGYHYQESFLLIFVVQNALSLQIFTILFMVTPIINPLLYNLASSQFRKALYQMFCGHCGYLHCKVFTAAPESTQHLITLKSQSTKESRQLPSVN